MRQWWVRVAAGVTVGALAVACGDEAPDRSGPATPGTPAAPAPAQTKLIGSNLERDHVDVPAGDLQAVVDADTAFALSLFEAVTGDDNNVFLSPYSIASALSMTLPGARGETAAQMVEALRISLAQEVLHRSRNALDAKISEPVYTPEGFDPLKLAIANSLWGQTGYDFRKEFLDVLARAYGAGVRLVDYAADPEAARAAVNAWVAKVTKDRIKDLLPADLINQLTRFVLVNAIYFKANWVNKFEAVKTVPSDFRRLDGTTVSVPTMHNNKKYDYAEGDGWKAARLPYAGGASMLVIAPDEGHFSDLASKFDPQFLQSVHAALRQHMVDLAMPKFAFESRIRLKDGLRKLGMVDAFTPPPGEGTADFTGITPARELFIREVVHQANVSVDENGTEAAAATAVIGEALSLPPPATLHLDRPFLFLIENDQTHEILFLGRVLDPSA